MQQDKITLQERIKKTFDTLDIESKELQNSFGGLQNDLTNLKKDKKILINQITDVTIGKLSKQQQQQSQLESSISANRNLNTFSSPPTSTTTLMMTSPSNQPQQQRSSVI